MDQYITVKGIYDNGHIRLLEIPDQNIVSQTKVMVLIPMQKSKTNKKPFGIPISDFDKKMNLFAIGGDALNETEDLYND